MKKFASYLVLIVAAALVPGCGSVTHSRPVKDITTGAWAPQPEVVKVRSFFQKIDANAISSETKDGPAGYTRKVGVGSISGQSEVEKLGILLEKGGSAFGAFMRAYQGQAPTPTPEPQPPTTRSIPVYPVNRQAINPGL